ncbi:hypothetical protein [Streptomyces sp. NPDC101132]|uniref:hypothetical protein n=1 Tax=Streptomyces sp. NPDC101132 TaxID=3366110 RepID=UPI0037F46977
MAGYSDALDKTTVDGQLVGGISGLAVRHDGLLAAVSDRSVLFTPDAARGDVQAARAPARLPLTDGAGGPVITDEFAPAVRRYAPDGGCWAPCPSRRRSGCRPRAAPGPTRPSRA